ncbi:branched-chain amino acid ABC transporter permease [soil metagenome]
MNPTKSRWPRWAPWCVVALLAVFPLVAPVFGIDFYVGFVRRMLIFAIAAASLNFILGYGGLAVLGHAGFVGVGAYALVAFVDANVSSAWIVWPGAMAASALMGLLIGLVALRTKGIYLIMSTLAFAQMLYVIAVSLRKYGGDDGYTLSQPTSFAFGYSTADNRFFYWTVLLLFVSAMAVLNLATRSRLGHALMGIRDNEVRMQALGYPVFALKLAAFTGAAAIAGLAGALLAAHNSFVSPAIMHWTQSATLLVMVLIGGAGLRYGGPIGAVVWIGLEEVARLHTEYWHWPLGVVLLIVTFAAPRGIATIRLWRARSGSSMDASAAPVASPVTSPTPAVGPSPRPTPVGEPG